MTNESAAGQLPDRAVCMWSAENADGASSSICSPRGGQCGQMLRSGLRVVVSFRAEPASLLGSTRFEPELFSEKVCMYKQVGMNQLCQAKK